MRRSESTVLDLFDLVQPVYLYVSLPHDEPGFECTLHPSPIAALTSCLTKYADRTIREIRTVDLNLYDYDLVCEIEDCTCEKSHD